MTATIDLSVPIACSIDAAVELCRSAAARQCFPGARNLRSNSSGLSFEVGIRAPGAEPALVVVDEYMKDFGKQRGGYWFETSQVWMWPNRECATTWHRYRITRSSEGVNLNYRWRYILPGLAGAQVFNAVRFYRSIEKAAEIYLSRLAQKGSS